MDIKDRIIEKYKKDRSIKDEYVLNDDEMYLIDEIVQLKIGQTIPIDSVMGSDCDLEKIINEDKNYALGFFTGDELKKYLSDNYA